MDGSNDFIRRMSLSGGIDCGIVTMKDGEEVKYWFLSHHGSGDQGHARFEFPGGRARMMTGYFCCEVMFPQDEFLSVRLVAKSPYAKGRFFRFWILPLSREFCYSPGDGVTI